METRIRRWSEPAVVCISLQLQQTLRKWERTRSWKKKLLPSWGSFWVSNIISGWRFCRRGWPSGRTQWFHLKTLMCLLQSTLGLCGCCCWWRIARETPMLISFRSTSERASARTSQTAWASETCSPGPAQFCWRTFLESTQVKGALCASCSYSNILHYYMATLKVVVILLWLFFYLSWCSQNSFRVQSCFVFHLNCASNLPQIWIPPCKSLDNHCVNLSQQGKAILVYLKGLLNVLFNIYLLSQLELSLINRHAVPWWKVLQFRTNVHCGRFQRKISLTVKLMMHRLPKWTTLMCPLVCRFYNRRELQAGGKRSYSSVEGAEELLPSCWFHTTAGTWVSCSVFLGGGRHRLIWPRLELFY